MINYQEVKVLSEEMIDVLSELRDYVSKFKTRTELFSDSLGDKISSSALSLAENIAQIADDTEKIIRDQAIKVGDFAETLQQVENTMKNKADNV